MRWLFAIFTTRCEHREVDVESIFVPGHQSGLGRHLVYVTLEGAAAIEVPKRGRDTRW